MFLYKFVEHRWKTNNFHRRSESDLEKDENRSPTRIFVFLEDYLSHSGKKLLFLIHNRTFQ